MKGVDFNFPSQDLTHHRRLLGPLFETRYGTFGG
jgi:hypothetical protein